MTDIFGSDQSDQSDQDGKGRGPEVEGIAGSRSAGGAFLDDEGDGGFSDGEDGEHVDAELVDDEVVDDEVVDAEVVDDELEDDATQIISGTSPEIGDLKEALAQRDEYLDSLRRLQAEFENYKKRVAKQQSDQIARAALSLVDKLLPVLDTLDLATSHIGDAESADGRALVAASGQLRDLLAREGLERIDPLGEEFDPTAHEAVGHVPAEEGGSPGAPGEPVVAEVMRAGYRWRGAVVRPAMVMVRG